LYHGELQKQISIPIIDLRAGVEQELIKRNIKEITVLGTPETAKRLYNFRNISIRLPSTLDQQRIANTIENFNKGANKAKQVSNLREVALRYENIMLSCTEVSLMAKDLSAIDTFNVLIEMVLEKLNKIHSEVNNNG